MCVIACTIRAAVTSLLLRKGENWLQDLGVEPSLSMALLLYPGKPTKKLLTIVAGAVYMIYTYISSDSSRSSSSSSFTYISCSGRESHSRDNVEREAEQRRLTRKRLQKL